MWYPHSKGPSAPGSHPKVSRLLRASLVFSLFLTIGVTIAVAVSCGSGSRDSEGDWESESKDGDFSRPGSPPDLSGGQPPLVCPPQPNKASGMESGSIADVVRQSPSEFILTVRDDNADCRLPASFRDWFYLRLDNVPVNREVTIQVKGRGWPFHIVPVFSYDNVKWRHFEERSVTKPSGGAFTIRARFEKSQVYLARFYPYTYSKLDTYLKSLCGSVDLTQLGEQTCTHPHVKFDVIGKSLQGRGIPMLTLSDFEAPVEGKSRVWIHARTHPGETGSSFVAEGILYELLSATPQSLSALKKLEVNIVPMQNVDGVVLGNTRTSSRSENLEASWIRQTGNPFALDPSVPQEVKVLHGTLQRLLTERMPLTMALNLHSSNSEPDMPAFFFPHFGPAYSGYTRSEASLWTKQLRFIADTSRFYGGKVARPGPEGGSEFVKMAYPESWFWANYKDGVMAMTIESTYGRAGFAPRWVNERDIFNLGRAVGKAIQFYHGIEPTAGLATEVALSE